MTKEAVMDEQARTVIEQGYIYTKDKDGNLWRWKQPHGRKKKEVEPCSTQ